MSVDGACHWMSWLRIALSCFFLAYLRCCRINALWKVNECFSSVSWPGFFKKSMQMVCILFYLRRLRFAADPLWFRSLKPSKIGFFLSGSFTTLLPASWTIAATYCFEWPATMPSELAMEELWAMLLTRRKPIADQSRTESLMRPRGDPQIARVTDSSLSAYFGMP